MGICDHVGDGMTDIDGFLNTHGWSDGARIALAGDASTRRYIRLCSSEKRAILMVDREGDTDRFATMAHHLLSIGLSAPKIFAQIPGLMLLEDFGDDQFISVITKEPNTEIALYTKATDVLLHLLQTSAREDLEVATPDVLGQMIEPVFWHHLAMLETESAFFKDDLTARLIELLTKHLPSRQVLVLRDYHAENLIWLPDRSGIKRVGLLDFQDALMGPPVYDLVSLLHDARRDVSDACVQTVLTHYVEKSGARMDTTLDIFHLLGLQRNLRILGIFARLAQDSGKPAYLNLIPRVWRHIQTSLRHPVAAPLKTIIDAHFPTPTSERLNRMKASCPTP